MSQAYAVYVKGITPAAGIHTTAVMIVVADVTVIDVTAIDVTATDQFVAAGLCCATSVAISDCEACFDATCGTVRTQTGILLSTGQLLGYEVILVAAAPIAISSAMTTACIGYILDAVTAARQGYPRQAVWQLTIYRAIAAGWPPGSATLELVTGTVLSVPDSAIAATGTLCCVY